MKFNLIVGGKAGAGIEALSSLISSSLVKAGFYVFTSRDYQSLIRGGHNFNFISFSDKEVHSEEEQIDLLIAFDENSYQQHKGKLRGEKIVFTSDKRVAEGKAIFLDINKLGLAGNMAFAGALFKIFSLDKKILFKKIEQMFSEKFAKLDKEVVEQFYSQDYDVNVVLPQAKQNKELMNGAQAIVQGAIEAGMERYFGYPMTPSTSVLTMLAQKQKEQQYKVIMPENEIAIINMALGASFAGRKVMVGTSSGGFDLMTEGLSLQGISELPLVMHLAQRTGPGTGVPTYTAQSDLNVAVYGGHGDFPRVVFTPGDVKEAYQKTVEAFYLAEKYGVLVIILTDKHLLESSFTAKLAKTKLKVPVRKEFPGKKVFKRSSYEHDSAWNTTEDAEEIKLSVERRRERGKKLAEGVESFTNYHLQGKGKNLVVSFGSTKGALVDAMAELDIMYIHLSCVEPFPREILIYLNEAKKVLVVEENASGQLADLITKNTGVVIKERILKYDGRPFGSVELIKEIRRRI